MEITNEIIDKLANLSRLKFDEGEKETIKKDLQRMVSFVEKINELELGDIPPRLHMSSEINVLRLDEVKGSIQRDIALKNAPLTDGAFIKVPKVIKK